MVKLKKSNLVKATAQQIKDVAKTKDSKSNAGFEFISSGSTMLNLGLSDKVNGGWCTGKVANLIGDSSAGKSFLAWTMFAEICRNPIFDLYDLFYDDTEYANEFDIPYLFGSKTKKRVDCESYKSDTIQKWYTSILKLIAKGDPFIYVLDSFDGLNSDEEKARTKKMLTKKEGTEIEGSYKTEKARLASEVFRNITEALSKTSSMLLVISQTRDNIGVTFGSKKTRSGGKALKFYSTYEVWLAVSGAIKKESTKIKRTVGNDIIAKVSKNKITGKQRIVSFPIYYDFGVDDITSCINFLKETDTWKKVTGKGWRTGIEKLDGIGTLPEIIRVIENENLEDEVKNIVQDVWLKIENGVKTERKRRYE